MPQKYGFKYDSLYLEYPVFKTPKNPVSYKNWFLRNLPSAPSLDTEHSFWIRTGNKEKQADCLAAAYFLSISGPNRKGMPHMLKKGSREEQRGRRAEAIVIAAPLPFAASLS